MKTVFILPLILVAWSCRADSALFTFTSGPSSNPTAVSSSFELPQSAVPFSSIAQPIGTMGLTQYSFLFSVPVAVPVGPNFICDCDVSFSQTPENGVGGVTIVQSAGISCPTVGPNCPYADGDLFASTASTLFSFTNSGSTYHLTFDPGVYPFSSSPTVGVLTIGDEPIDASESSTFSLLGITLAALWLASIAMS
jgi:hypothetical protein